MGDRHWRLLVEGPEDRWELVGPSYGSKREAAGTAVTFSAAGRRCALVQACDFYPRFSGRVDEEDPRTRAVKRAYTVMLQVGFSPEFPFMQELGGMFRSRLTPERRAQSEAIRSGSVPPAAGYTVPAERGKGAAS